MPTETEAATMWCPHVRHPDDDKGGSWNRGPYPGREVNLNHDGTVGSYACNCIGSRCMAWRWKDTTNPILGTPKREAFYLATGYVRSADQDGCPDDRVRFELRPECRTGFCGLSGEPRYER